MQTFLPEPDFAKSAACLDYRRLGKQRVEAKQLLLALSLDVGPHKARTSHWSNHPAARMWRGYEFALCEYGGVVCTEWIRRGYNDTLLPQFEELSAELLKSQAKVSLPPWFGNKEFHDSHKSNLMRKDPKYYYWPNVPNNLEYVWPI